MDFNSLLNKAAKNATSVTKTLETVDSELAARKRLELKKIEADKRAKQELALKKRALITKREPVPEKKFVIPKKKATESGVDINGVKNFLAKQEESKKIAEKQKKIEKDNLIQLRIQSHGGKANKKIGKQFGMDPINLQIRYGNDHTHVERLQKQQWKEEEELDNMSTQYKGGVYKAIQERNKKLAEMKPGDKKEPHRVATSKSNSLYGLSSRHGNTRDHFSPPKETKKEVAKPPPFSADRKRPAAPPIDFKVLMKVAADKSTGKSVDLSTLAPPPPKIAKQNADRPSSSKDIRLNNSSSSSSFKKLSSSTKDHRDQRISSSSSNKPKLATSNPSSSKRPEPSSVLKSDLSKKNSNTAKQSDKDDKGKKDTKGRFVKAPTPPPAIPSAVLGKRYLPGDVRIKQQQEIMKTAGITPPSSSSNKKEPDMESLFGASSSSRKSESSKVRVPDNRGSSTSNNYCNSSSSQRHSQPSSKSSNRPSSSLLDKEKTREIERRKKAMEQKRYEQFRWERMSLVERERERERQKFREMYQDEEEDEDGDEYDSGDDFIDDSGMDMDDFNRMDFEETLKMVNPKYDEKKWKIREKMINERDMETNYRNISREEARSARLGFMEDVLEAKKRKSIRL